jgi:23S rRNA-intervening sequence protein
MNRIKRFEDIVAWQKARLLTKDVYAAAKLGAFAHDYGLKDQIQRASVSTMANIAEGFERGGDKEFAQFLSNSKVARSNRICMWRWTKITSLLPLSKSFTRVPMK